eukprot:SAG31_NODE_228_length_19803_cov_29.496498_3_plen_93_part_00
MQKETLVEEELLHVLLLSWQRDGFLVGFNIVREHLAHRARDQPIPLPDSLSGVSRPTADGGGRSRLVSGCVSTHIILKFVDSDFPCSFLKET